MGAFLSFIGVHVDEGGDGDARPAARREQLQVLHGLPRPLHAARSPADRGVQGLQEPRRRRHGAR